MADLISRLAARTARAAAAGGNTRSTVEARPRPRSMFEPGAPSDPRAVSGRADVPIRQAGAEGGGDLNGSHRGGSGTDEADSQNRVAAGMVPSRTDRGDDAPGTAVAPQGRATEPGRTADPPGRSGRAPSAGIGTTSVAPADSPTDVSAAAGVSGQDRARGDGTTDRGRAADHARPAGSAPVVIARPARRADPVRPLPERTSGQGDRHGSHADAGRDGDTVSIHIGRLDVRANLEAVEPPRPEPAARDHRGPTLEEYLRGAEAGAGS